MRKLMFAWSGKAKDLRAILAITRKKQGKSVDSAKRK